MNDKHRRQHSMDYELYDLESTNLVAGPLTEERALALVRQALEEDGREVVEMWALGRIDHSGTPLVGQELIERSIKATAA